MSRGLTVLSLVLASRTMLGDPPAPIPPQLCGRIWQVKSEGARNAAGMIYIFLKSGMLLETSCVETYRIALWSADREAPNVLHVMEDGRPAFTAKILELNGSKLRFIRKLAWAADTREITLTAVTKEFVCPDLPK
ncbi:MAG: hypothetical protein JO270_15515 [Acidobacteriaceae bacterium]|nr:hypothetical protein [Acidobacteriaceae bacterium]MBV8573149.1 hypothetical protein [Acidobacteriaceae bacterium]